jgi:hypothetical protein
MAPSLTAKLCVVSILVVVSAFVHAAEPLIELRRNPFERPVIEESDPVATASTGAPAESADDGLRAVLVAGSKSSVNLGGVILQVGESSNGYELLSVEEGRAVFRNDGRKVVMSLYEQEGGAS